MTVYFPVEDLYEEIDPEDVEKHRKRLSEPHIHANRSTADHDDDDGDDYGKCKAKSNFKEQVSD